MEAVSTKVRSEWKDAGAQRIELPGWRVQFLRQSPYNRFYPRPTPPRAPRNYYPRAPTISRIIRSQIYFPFLENAQFYPHHPTGQLGPVPVGRRETGREAVAGRQGVAVDAQADPGIAAPAPEIGQAVLGYLA